MRFLNALWMCGLAGALWPSHPPAAAVLFAIGVAVGIHPPPNDRGGFAHA